MRGSACGLTMAFLMTVPPGPDRATQRLAGQPAIKALMLESHLVGGRQELGKGVLTYGQSITDACLSFDDTRRAIEGLAERLG